MNAPAERTLVSLVILVVLAVIIGAIYYFTLPASVPSFSSSPVTTETGPTPDEVQTALQAQATAKKDAIPPAREAQITKAMTASSSPTQQSAIPADRQAEIMKALQAK